jgi:hypothetical protein
MAVVATSTRGIVTMRGDAEPGSLGVEAIVPEKLFRNRLGIYVKA